MAFAAIVRKVCRKLSLNGSALKDEIVTKVCPTFHFGTIAVPRKRSHLLLKKLPFLLVVPVLAATLSWRNGQRDDKPFFRTGGHRVCHEGLPQLAHPSEAHETSSGWS